MNPQTGTIDRQPYPIVEVENRFEIVDQGSVAFRAEPEVVSLVAEAHRLQHAYLFNPLFATETSLIDLLPHQNWRPFMAFLPLKITPKGNSGCWMCRIYDFC